MSQILIVQAILLSIAGSVEVKIETLHMVVKKGPFLENGQDRPSSKITELTHTASESG